MNNVLNKTIYNLLPYSQNIIISNKTTSQNLESNIESKQTLESIEKFMKLAYDLLLFILEFYDYSSWDNNVSFAGIIEISINLVLNSKLFNLNEEVISSASNYY